MCLVYYKKWILDKRKTAIDKKYLMDGWFLFGFIPIYIRRLGTV